MAWHEQSGGLASAGGLEEAGLRRGPYVKKGLVRRMWFDTVFRGLQTGSS